MSRTAESGFVDIDGAQIYYEIEGSGQPVVLVHGSMMDTRMWEPQVSALADRFRLVRFDQRGYGRSTQPPTSYRSHEDFRRLFDALAIDRPHLVGSSMGGRFAVDYAVTYPDELASLVVLPGGLSGYEYSEPSFNAGLVPMIEAAERGDFAAATNLLLDFAPMRPAAAIPPVRTQLEAILADYSWQHFREPDPWLEMEPPALGRLGEIRAPTLVVAGELDIPDHHAQARILNERVPDVRLVELPGAGHMLNLEQPEAFNRVLLDFLVGQTASVWLRPG